MSDQKGMNRRHFLRNSALGVGAVGAGLLGGGNLLDAQQKPVEEKPGEAKEVKVKEYRTLGRTGFKVSDISSGYVKDPVLLEKLFEAGLNYVDSAEGYGNETEVGIALKKRDRKSIFITTKIEVEKDLSKEGFLARARKCLERLQTDYIDCMMMHGPEMVSTIKTEGFHEAMKQLKTEGKLRFVGVSNHGSNWYEDSKEPMEKVLTAAALDGRFDVFLLAYNFIQEDGGAQVLKLCKEKNIGTTLMKVNPIGKWGGLKERIEKMKSEGKTVPPEYSAMITKIEAKTKKAEEFIKKYELNDSGRMRDAAIRFVLSEPNVHTVCLAMRNFDDMNAYLALSGTRLSDMEKVKLSAYKEGCGEFYCRHACGVCEPACPHQVPVNSIMRFNHYFAAQGKEKYAMKNYANLPRPKADLCANCAGHCEKACPYGVPVHSLLYLAHHTLTLA